MSPGPVGDLESTEAESRRAARERALELLYEAEAKGVGVDAILDGLPLPPDALAVELARGVDAHRARIDEALSRLVAPKWSLARLATVDRAILRMAGYELYEAADRSQALVINEAVLLARRFGTDDSPRFVNGVLSSLAAEARPGGAPPVAAPADDDVPSDSSSPVAEHDVDEVRPAPSSPVAEDGVDRAGSVEAVPASEDEPAERRASPLAEDEADGPG